MNDCDRYWTLANAAINEGLLTRAEALVIARVGTRKQNFWARHILDLNIILEKRKEVTA